MSIKISLQLFRRFLDIPPNLYTVITRARPVEISIVKNINLLYTLVSH